MNPLPRIIFILENHKLNRIIDLYKALYKISMIKYNSIKSCYAKSAMMGKKGETECHFKRRKT